MAKWSGVISSKSFCSQLARLDSSSFRKRTFPCNTKHEISSQKHRFCSILVMNHMHSAGFQLCLVQSAGHPSLFTPPASELLNGKH